VAGVLDLFPGTIGILPAQVYDGLSWLSLLVDIKEVADLGQQERGNDTEVKDRLLAGGSRRNA
jgi:hypothetical protein